MSLESDHKAIPTYDISHGLDRSRQPWQTPEGTWYTAENMRFRDGIVTQTPTAHHEAFEASQDVALFGDNAIGLWLQPVDGAYTRLIAVCENTISIPVVNGSTLLDITPIGYSTNLGQVYKSQAAVDNSGLYLTDYVNPVYVVVNGGTATELIATGPEYRARYIESYTGHLVLAYLYAASEGGQLIMRVAWSDLNDFSDFAPTTVNEADFYDIRTNQINGLTGKGITGLKRLGDIAVIYTQSSVYNMQYVGFDNGVMNFHEQITGVGCEYPYSVVGLDHYHVFISRDDFLVYDGQSLRSIGAPVRKYFFEDLHTDQTKRDRTWGWIDQRSRECRWYYISNANDTQYPDKCVVFNYETKEWYIESGHNRVCAVTGDITIATSIDSLDSYAATIDGLDGVFATIDSMDLAYYVRKDLFSAPYAAATADYDLTPNVDIVRRNLNQFVLETGDIIAGDVQTFKEVDTLLTDFYWSVVPVNGTATTAKVEVYVAVRDYLTAPVVYTRVGLWTPASDVQLRFTHLRKHGRVFRFKFVGSQVIDASFAGLTLNFKESPSER